MLTKRIVAVYSFMMFLVVLAICGVASATLNGGAYAEAVNNQSRYTLQVAASRGTIYDRNLEPLTNSRKKYMAAVAPNADSAAALFAAAVDENREVLRAALEDGTPFVTEVSYPVQTDGIKSFEVFSHFDSPQPAANLIGYLENGRGADGIEKSFDALLSENSGQISVTFSIDALGNAILGAETEVDDTYSTVAGGVVLTLDRALQMEVESACAEIETGAAVVLRCDTGEIVASASFPAIDANRLDLSLSDTRAPFLNRALQGFAPGSVFKLFMAAAALEAGMDYNKTYTCDGYITVDGMRFSCYDGDAHGEVNMHTALRKSCNGYFIQLLQKINAKDALDMCRALGLGTAHTLADGLSDEAGFLPEAADIKNARARANFAFGQGETLTTPLQLAAAVNAIANGGTYLAPTLLYGTANADGTLLPEAPKAVGKKCMEATTANRLRAYMESTARFGTARRGAPEGCVSGIKTGTAQTGVDDENGDEIMNCWYAGYICDAENTPVYTVVVLEETAGDSTVGDAFKKIGEALLDFI